MNEPTRSIQGFAETLQDAVRQHPLPAAMIGMGLVWLISGKAARGQARQTAHRVGADRLPEAMAETAAKGPNAVRAGYDAAIEAAGDVAATLSRSAESLLDCTSAANAKAGSGAREAATQLRDWVGSVVTFDNARTEVANMLEKQPLLIGVVGLGIGAALAAAVPASELENQLLGEARDSFLEQARDFSREHMGSAGHIAESFVESAKDEAKAQIKGVLTGV